MRQQWWLWLERAQAAVPLIVVAGVAGFTWWLVQSSPRVSGPARPAQSASVPDFVLDKARVARFDATGRIEAVLDGERMRHYPDTDRLQVDEPRLTARDDKGQSMKATAKLGEATHRAEQLTLSGGTHVTALPTAATAAQAGVRHSPIDFMGERVQIDTVQRVITSTDPVTLRQQGSEVHAQTLRHDEGTGITDLGGRVHGHYDVVRPAPKTPAPR